jgi:hypothetical protein
VRALEGFGGRLLQERAGLSVDGPPDEVVRRGVTDVELEPLVEFDEFDEFRPAECAGLGGRRVGLGRLRRRKRELDWRQGKKRNGSPDWFHRLSLPGHLATVTSATSSRRQKQSVRSESSESQ